MIQCLKKHKCSFYSIKLLFTRPFHGLTQLLVGLYACGKKCTAQKMKFSIKDFFGKCDQIRRKLAF